MDLEHDLVQGEIGDEPFQLGVFVTQLLQLAGLAGQHPPVHFLPAVERLLGHAGWATDVPHGNAGVHLLQDRSDLLDGKALLLHATSSWPSGRIVPQNSP